ncbi:MAG: SDR family NAD(P)-dependent oxidoreductase [Microscillaceae bacterium]|nr:SDR family NAD(P)-dependent oxidoreductase [Microscillaceae bacterium]MDW8461764.1 SDR family NAD(P)-dependent oxidoreductase [Cytophagales bacterium]
MKQKTVLITGATSGIGKATAEQLAKQQYRVIICGRRQERLTNLQNTLLLQTSQVHSLCFDVAKPEEVAHAIASLPPDFQDIDVLINNAGNAHGLAPIHEGDLRDWEAMIDTNLKGLLYVSKCIIPQMVEKQRGHIINIGSIAGKEVYAQGNVYCASKFAVDALTQAMRIDLHKYNIKVSAINPGLVETEFSLVRFKGDTERAKKVYSGFTPLTATDIAEIIAFILSRPAHVNIADLLVLPTAQANTYLVNRKTE